MRIVLTGARGLVGSHLDVLLREQGHTVVPLLRPAFHLGREIPADALRGADALIHCAYDFQPHGEPTVREANVEGSLKLFEAARQAGVPRRVFVSSIAAFEGCRSVYGRCKLEVEQAVLRDGGIVVRPGLIHGDTQSRGMLGTLARVSGLPLLPMIGGGRFVFYLAHVDDVVRLLAEAVVNVDTWRGRILVAAHPQAWTLLQLLRELGRRQGRGRLSLLCWRKDPKHVPAVPTPAMLSLV